MPKKTTKALSMNAVLATPGETGEKLAVESHLTSAERGALAQMVMSLFDHWKTSSEDQAVMLGLAADNRSALARYRRGSPIGNSRDQIERVGHLLAIHKNLRILFPQNRDLAYRWMTTRNRAFQHRTPVEMIIEVGFGGLLAVRGYLDRQRGT